MLILNFGFLNKVMEYGKHLNTSMLILNIIQELDCKQYFTFKYIYVDIKLWMITKYLQSAVNLNTSMLILNHSK